MAAGAVLMVLNPFSALTPSFWLSLVLTGAIVAFVSQPASGRLVADNLASADRGRLIRSDSFVFLSDHMGWFPFKYFPVPVLTLIALP